MQSLSETLTLKYEELSREAWPHFSPGWDLGQTIQDGPERFILDWTTGY